MFYYYAILLYVTANYELPQLYQIQTHQNLIYFYYNNMARVWIYFKKQIYLYNITPARFAIGYKCMFAF